MTNAAALPAVPWELDALFEAPQMYAAETEEPGLRALFYDGVPYNGKPTRVFAYYGVPEGSAGTKLPAMVLVHGGSGSAYAEWVRMWNRHGYAAIAMDHFGNIPGLAPEGQPYAFDLTRNPDGGPHNSEVFTQVDLPFEEQWPYHAVAAAILGHSLLRTFPEVDADKIGLTGISWGGYLTSIISGLDTRFQFAAPVYGCGFLHEDSGWMEQFAAMGASVERWKELHDPSVYLPRAELPMLWKNGTNDSAFPLPSWKKSINLTKGPTTISLEVEMDHGQHEGAIPAEIYAFVDSIFDLGPKLAEVGAIEPAGEGVIQVAFESEVPIVKAELNYTADTGPWIDRKWQAIPAEIKDGSSAEAELPADAQAYFFNIIDERGLIVSSEYKTR